jgi:hypothetical protein
LVPRSVVDQYDFVIVADRIARGAGQPIMKRGQARFLVEAWDDD